MWATVPLVDLDLRRVRYFVEVAERLSFVHAAEVLHITQPALTRQIAALERQLGVRLFERDRRGTLLTPAGAQLLTDSRSLLAAALAMERRARLAARPSTRVTIGFMPGVPITPLMAEFEREAPHVAVDTVFTSMVDQLEFVLDGRVDVCFVRLPIPGRQVEIVPLFTEPKVAAVPADSPVAAADSLSPHDLAGMALVRFAHQFDAWTGPEVGFHESSVEDVLQSVAAGHGFAVLPAGIGAFYRRDDVACIPLTDVAPVVVALAQRRARRMPELDRFARLAREHLAAPEPAEP